MGYKSAIYVLPDDLLKAVQRYIDGEYIYIPRTPENKRQWGEIKIADINLTNVIKQFLSNINMGYLLENWLHGIIYHPKPFIKYYQLKLTIVS